MEFAFRENFKGVCCLDSLSTLKMKYHIPVLVNEILEILNVSEGKKFIDCTLGDGGHTLEILKRGGFVYGFDVSGTSLERAKKRIEELGYKDLFMPINSNFSNLEEEAKRHNIQEVDGILYDLGYSTYQLETEDFGLSLQKDAPLDMRLDKNLSVLAMDFINVLSEKELARLFFEFGQENQAKKFARAIVKARNLKKIQTTKQLADLVSEISSGYEHGRIHPATRIFQALRIAVNQELENLESSLPQAVNLLKKPIEQLPGGRIAVISFHSLEDKIVKALQNDSRLMELFKKPLVPGFEEIKLNRKARSAKLRAYERI